MTVNCGYILLASSKFKLLIIVQQLQLTSICMNRVGALGIPIAALKMTTLSNLVLAIIVTLKGNALAVNTSVCRYGPLLRHWTMRYEAKHCYFKKLAHSMGNFINLPYSLAMRHQQHQCFMSQTTLGGMTTGPCMYSRYISSLVVQGHKYRQGVDPGFQMGGGGGGGGGEGCTKCAHKRLSVVHNQV